MEEKKSHVFINKTDWEISNSKELRENYNTDPQIEEIRNIL